MKKGIFVINLMLAPFFVMSQSFDVSVSSDSILIGNYLELKFTAENLEGNFEGPQLDDFIVRSGPNQSTSVQIINSSTSSLRTWSYYIEPRIEGQIVIPPVYFITEKKTYETSPIEINVFPNPDGIITEPSSGNSFFKNFEFPMFDFNQEPPSHSPNKLPPTKSKRDIKRI